MVAVGSVKRGVPAGGWCGRISLACPPLYPVLAHLAGERVAVHPEGAGGLGEAAVALAQDADDEALFELVDRVVEPAALFDHLLDELFQAIRDHASSRPVRRR